MSLGMSGDQVLALLLATIRTGAWLTLCPPFSSRSVPRRVKTLLSLAIALPMVPQTVQHLPAPEFAPVMGAALQQVVIGAAMGFLTAMVFAAVQTAGNLLDVAGGFSMAMAYDPMTNSGSAILGRFYNLMALTLLFVTDAHQLILLGFTGSFRTLPLDGSLSLATMADLLTGGMADLFVNVLQIAGPLLAVLLCADIGLGLLSRAAPALNIFSISFPVKILVTLLVVGFSLALLPSTVDGLVGEAVRSVLRLVRA